MPRIYGSNNDPWDYCAPCFPPEEDDRHHDDGDGPDGRGDCYSWNAEHPAYGGEDYVCTSCREPLTDEDN